MLRHTIQVVNFNPDLRKKLIPDLICNSHCLRLTATKTLIGHTQYPCTAYILVCPISMSFLHQPVPFPYATYNNLYYLQPLFPFPCTTYNNLPHFHILLTTASPVSMYYLQKPALFPYTTYNSQPRFHVLFTKACPFSIYYLQQPALFPCTTYKSLLYFHILLTTASPVYRSLHLPVPFLYASYTYLSHFHMLHTPTRLSHFQILLLFFKSFIYPGTIHSDLANFLYNPTYSTIQHLYIHHTFPCTSYTACSYIHTQRNPVFPSPNNSNSRLFKIHW